MKKVFLVLLVVSQAVGCAKAGFEMRVGGYREDVSHQESTAYFRPLKCYVTDCSEGAEIRPREK